MRNIAIVEDQDNAAQRLAGYIDKYAAETGQEFRVTRFCNGEEFLKDYFKKNLNRPIEAGFRFGNIVTPVYRANPCEHLVIEAFVRKKFVFATPKGYAAITHLIDQYLLNE